MRNLRETILIVEDDAQIRNFISFTLHSEDYAYETAPNGKTAMQMLVSRPIDLMLLDLGLPDVDGMDIIKKYGNGRRSLLSWCRPGTRIKRRRWRWIWGPTTI